MASPRSQIYKIVAIVILFLVFLQYLYLYPVKLNLTSFKTPSPISSSELNYDRSLFNFKTADYNNRKRSPEEEETSFEGNSESAKMETTKEQIPNKNPRLKMLSTLKSHEKGFVSTSLPSSSSTSTITSNNNLTANLTSKSHRSSSSNANNLNTNDKEKQKQNDGTHFLKSQTQTPTTTTTNNSKNKETNMSYCPEKNPTLIGNINVVLTDVPTLPEIGRIHNDIALGGLYKPPNCVSKDKVAIIVPFRDREEHLRVFLFNLLPILKRQQVQFNIFVIEQGSGTNDEPFNRAMLFNVGYMEANKRGKFDCFIFHDVDLIPENDYNLYNCPVQPRHMSVAVDKMQYKLPYRTIFGGISALTGDHFRKVNGFSNSFWGWGAEDDDMAGRIAFHGLYISRPPANIARYKMLKHKQQKLNNQRYRMLQKGKTRFRSDGLSNLKYSVETVVQEKTYTLVRVQLAKP